MIKSPTKKEIKKLPNQFKHLKPWSKLTLEEIVIEFGIAGIDKNRKKAILNRLNQQFGIELDQDNLLKTLEIIKVCYTTPACCQREVFLALVKDICNIVRGFSSSNENDWKIIRFIRSQKDLLSNEQIARALKNK